MPQDNQLHRRKPRNWRRKAKFRRRTAKNAAGQPKSAAGQTKIHAGRQKRTTGRPEPVPYHHITPFFNKLLITYIPNQPITLYLYVCFLYFAGQKNENGSNNSGSES